MSSARLPDAGKHGIIDGQVTEALKLALENAPSACAVTKGSAHTLIYANQAFRRLSREPYEGQEAPITDVLVPEATTRLQSLLDRALACMEVLDDRVLGLLVGGNQYWSCTIWPLWQAGAVASDGLVIQLHRSPHPTPNLALQREVAERLLITALQQTETAEHAESSLARSKFLEESGRRLNLSLDTTLTRGTVAGMSLPILGTWCIVDLIEVDGSILRLAMIHPEPQKQELLRTLARQWHPEPGDPFGGPAVKPDSAPFVIDSGVDAALEAAAHTPENLQLLRELNIATLLVVPMKIGPRLLGAVTFVTAKPGRAYSAEEIELAEDLAARSAEALENAHIYGEALLLREQAEHASENRMQFLGNISHELRTPLNAIIGYVDVISEEIHGPVTPAQSRDLERIRFNQAHLLVLVNDLLTFVRAGAPRTNQIVSLPAHAAVAAAADLLQTKIVRKSIHYEAGPEDPAVIAFGDPERVRQILVNLIANAVKFTPRGGHVTSHCIGTEKTVLIRIADNGIGIAAKQLEAIFEPFVQVDPAQPIEGGVGLGLAISRDLARTMQGDLTVESTLGRGTTFTLTLPRASV